MSADYLSDVEELMARADELADGPGRLALIEEAVRLADTHQDLGLGFELRGDLIRTATFSGYPEKSLVAFSWRLAQCDRDPRRFSEYDLLWEYKWVTDSLAAFPQITRGQIDDALTDMARRYERCGLGLQPVHKLRCLLALDMQDLAEARAHYRAWKRAGRDGGSDCLACEHNHEVKYFLATGQDDKALQTAGPILAGPLRCAEIPHATLSLVLFPLLRQGRPGEAMAHHHRGYRLVAGNRKFVGEAGKHLTFLALTDNLARAVKLFEKHLAWAVETRDLLLRFDFYLAARFLLERVAEAGEGALKLRLPASFPAHQEGGRYEVAALAAWFEAALGELAGRFDARNGNDGFARRLHEARGWKEWVTPFPLKPARSDNAE
jgi:hypothetical protein